MKSIRIYPGHRVFSASLLLCGIAFVFGCDMSSNMATDQSTAYGTLIQNFAGFLFDFARQLIAAFIF